MTDLRVAALQRDLPDGTGRMYGSGYLVADRLVLTAAHVVGAVGETLEMRLGDQRVTGTVIWRACAADAAPPPPDDAAPPPPDAALVEIDDARYEPADLPPVRWGRIVGRGPAVGCTATGYPDALAALDGRVEADQVGGEIMPLTRGAGGRVDVIPKSWPEPGLWRGMSGAAVLSASCQLVVAVVVETAENFQDRRLTALTVAALRDDRSFTDLVELHTGRPFVLEPVELEEALRPWHRPTRPQSPIALLRPEYEVAPFSGRAQTLRRLVSWCTSGARAGGLLIHAAGGTGKTRLARELARTMYQSGWIVGELSDAATAFAPFTRLAHPALILIDYAESRARATAALLRHIAEHPGQHPVRVLMLARSAGPWWDQLLNDAVVATTLPDEPQELGGLEFDAGSGSGEHLTVLAGAFSTALRQVPGYADHDRRTHAFQLPWELEPTRAYHPLTLHIAVLASVLTGPDSGTAPTSPARILLGHEEVYWSRLAAERSLGHPETRNAALVFALLCGAHSRQQAARTIGLLPGFRSDSAEDARRALAHWIATLYPPADPRAAYWGQLTPDWLFEHLLATTVEAEPELFDNLASLDDDGSMTRLTGEQFDRAITVLTAAAAGSGEAAAAVRRKLIELVAIHNGVFLPYACFVSMRAQHPEPLLTALKVLIGHRSAQLQHLHQIRSFMPPTGGILADLGVAVQQRIVDMVRASTGTEDGGRELAHALDLLGTYLARAGRIEEALAVSGEAVAILRSHEEDTDIEDLAHSLTNHATNLARTGSREESYRLCREVVDVLDHSDLPHERRRRLLVGPLNNIALYHEEHGDFGQALEEVTRAIALQREELADTADGFDLDTMAQLLTNQANCLEHLGRPADALAANEACMEIWRRLYRGRPGTYAEPFLRQALLLADNRRLACRHAEAAALYGEAGEALSRLPARSGEQQLRLGLVLQNQAHELHRAGAPFASVVHVLQHACTVLGDLFRHDPKLSATPYFELLKMFVQGTQLVAEDIDIKPYMAEVGAVLDHIVSEWEAAGYVPDEVVTVPNLAMYVAWAIEDGDLTTAIELCERVEALATDGSDATARLDQETFQATVMMLRARAMARRGDVAEAAHVATVSAGRLAERATPENHWPALVAADGLFDMAVHMSATDAPQETLALNRAGSAIALQHVAGAPDVFAPVLANHLVNQARTHTRLGEHEAAVTLLETTLEHVRGLADDPEQEQQTPLVTYDIRQAPVSPSRHESFDEVLSLYIVELQKVEGRNADLLAAVAELVDLRRRRWEADGGAEQALSYAWIAHMQATALIRAGRPEAAVTAARNTLAVAKDLTVPDDESEGTRAAILHDTAIVLINADAVDDAVTAISACVEIYRTGHAPSAKELASSLGDLSSILGTAGRQEESFTAGDEALALWRELAAGDPDELEGLAICLHNQALTRMRSGREDEARELRAELEALLAGEG